MAALTLDDLAKLAESTRTPGQTVSLAGMPNRPTRPLPADLFAGQYGTKQDMMPTIDPTLGFVHPTYSGSDPGYAAWLATANQQQADAIAQARARRAQLNDAYRQALADMDRQAVGERRGIQNTMLGRGIFRSGETDRRQQEYDALVGQARQRANSTLTQQIGDVDVGQQNTMSSLASQAASQVSQAMMRDALAAYNAQQAAAAAAPPEPVYTPTPTQAPQQQQQQQQQKTPLVARPASTPASTPSFDLSIYGSPAPKPKPAPVKSAVAARKAVAI